MSTRNEQFLTLYKTHRHAHQMAFYIARRDEFEKAQRASVTLTSALLALTTIASLLASLMLKPKPLWTILSVAFPAFSTALSAYTELYAFDRQAKLYRDTLNPLRRAEADAPDLEQGLTDAEYSEKLAVYVNNVEGIFRREQGQWGQLISSIKPVEPQKKPDGKKQ